MSKTLKLKAKSGDVLTIDNFKYAQGNKQGKIEQLENLIISNQIISFIGENSMVSLTASEIEYFILTSK